MSFLDHFRRKPSEAAQPPGTQIRSGAQKTSESGIDRASAGIPVAAPHSAESAQGHVVKENLSPVAPEANGGETRIRFSVGDFLHRIPQQLLKPGQHDITFEVSFDAADVADRIARGQTTIALVEVYKRAPHIFRREIGEADNID